MWSAGSRHSLRTGGLVVVDDSPLAASEPAERLGLGSSATDTRYRMLETIRQFATERLALETTATACLGLRRRHAEYFAGLASRAQSGLESAEEAGWTTRLECEEANLRAAFSEFETGDGATLCLTTAAALGRHWRDSGRCDTGRTLLGLFLDPVKPSDVDLSVRGDALLWMGRLAVESGIVGEDRKGADQAIAAIDAGLALHREAGHPQGLLRGIEAALADRDR